MAPGTAEGSPGHGVFRCTNDDLDELIRFQSRVQPERDRTLDPAHIGWLFGPNPSRSDNELTMWISRRGGRIVGNIGAILAEVQIDGEPASVAWSVEALVDERWRGTEVAQELAEARNRVLDSRFFGALGISDAGHRFALRRGYVGMSPMSTRVWLADPSRLLARHGPPPRFAQVARPFVLAAGTLVRGLCRLRSRRAELVPIESFDERSDTLWREVAPSYRVIGRRDAAWLEWRFDSCPERASYQRYYVSVDGAIVGFVVLRMWLRNEEPFLSVVDYLAAPRHLGPMFGLAALRAQALGAAGVVCRATHPGTHRSLRYLGYMRRHQGARFMVKIEGDDPLAPVVLNAGNWFLTAADSDVN